MIGEYRSAAWRWAAHRGWRPRTAPFHVVARCNNREFYFTSADDFAILLARLEEMAWTYGVVLYAYTLMSFFHGLRLVRRTRALCGPRY
jgi:hypothetical protein